MKYLIAGILGPIFWLVVLTASLWLVRRYAPEWERVLWSKPTDWLRMLRAIPGAFRRASTGDNLPAKG